MLLIESSMDSLQILSSSSRSFSVVLLMRMFCMVMAVLEGMIIVPIVGLCSFSSISSFERRSFQSGLIFTHLPFSSYFMSPCRERCVDTSISESMGRSNFLESSVRLCQVPFLILSRKSCRVVKVGVHSSG